MKQSYQKLNTNHQLELCQFTGKTKDKNYGDAISKIQSVGTTQNYCSSTNNLQKQKPSKFEKNKINKHKTRPKGFIS